MNSSLLNPSSSTWITSTSRAGKFKLKRRTAKKKFKAKVRELKTWFRSHLTTPLAEVWKTLNAKLGGHYQYYGINDNWPSLMKYRGMARRLAFRWLNRRSQAKSKNWSEFYTFIEPGFANSEWADQEVGFALGRRIDVIPIRVGEDPHGFIGKIQGVPAKGKLPQDVAESVVRLLLKKPDFRPKLLNAITKTFAATSSNDKIDRIRTLRSWSILSDEQTREALERAPLSDFEKVALTDIIKTVDAFKEPEPTTDGDDIPF